MVINGVTVRLTKYKLMIFDPKDDLSEDDAANIAMYLYEEGFIKKDDFPVEIIKPSQQNIYMRKKERCYLIVDEKNLLYGAFPYSEDGQSKAKKYLRKINKNKNLRIVEK